MTKLISVSSYTRRSPQPSKASRVIHDQLRTEVANFDHVPFVLVAELETALTGYRGEPIDIPNAAAAREAF